MRSQNSTVFLSAVVMSTILAISCHPTTQSKIPQNLEKERSQDASDPANVEKLLEEESQESTKEVEDADTNNDSTGDSDDSSKKTSHFHLASTNSADIYYTLRLSKMGPKTFLYTNNGWFAEIVEDEIVPKPEMSKGLKLRTVTEIIEAVEQVHELVGNYPTDAWLSVTNSNFHNDESTLYNLYNWQKEHWERSKKMYGTGFAFPSQSFEKGYLKFGKTYPSISFQEGVDSIDILFIGNHPSRYSLTNSKLRTAQNPFQGEIEIRSIQATTSDISGNIYIFGNACSGKVPIQEVQKTGVADYENVHCFPSVSYWKPGMSKAVISKLPDMQEQESPAIGFPDCPVFLRTQDKETFFSTTIRELNEKPYEPDIYTPYLVKWDGSSWKRLQVPNTSKIVSMEFGLDKGLWFAFENGELWHYSLKGEWTFTDHIPPNMEKVSIVETSPGNIWILSDDGNLYHNKPHEKVFEFDESVFPAMTQEQE